MSKYSWRKDGNHHAIARAFRQAGASVLDLSGVGDGCPDLLIGIAGVDLLVEIKLPVGKRGGTAHSDLNQYQRAFHGSWRGRTPVVVRRVEDVEALIDMLVDSTRNSDVIGSSAGDDL